MSARPYRSGQHLWSTVKTDAGTLAVLPCAADRLIFDAAKSNHVPAYRDTGDHGSTVLDIGRGARVRVSGHAELVGACWEIGTLYVSRREGGDATANMHARAEALVFEMLQEWAKTRAGDIAQADDIDRNNGAHRLEEKIGDHVAALRILRRELRACESGTRAFTAYPDLPTDGRR